MGKLLCNVSAKETKIDVIFNYLQKNKGKTVITSWVPAEEAWALPNLDCKAFSVLLMELLKCEGIASELWIGLNTQDEGHAWLELEINGERKVLDREFHPLITLQEHHQSRSYVMRKKI